MEAQEPNEALKKAQDNYRQMIESGDLVIDNNNDTLLNVLKNTSEFTQEQLDEINNYNHE